MKIKRYNPVPRLQPVLQPAPCCDFSLCSRALYGDPTPPPPAVVYLRVLLLYMVTLYIDYCTLFGASCSIQTVEAGPLTNLVQTENATGQWLEQYHE